MSNSAGAATSNSATLTVTAAPVAPTITTQPANQTVTAGQAATFTVTATGTAPLSYQWRKNGANIAGATSASCTTPAKTTSDISDIPQEHLFSPFSKEILVTLQESGLQGRIYADERRPPDPVSKSATIVLPTLLFIGAAAQTIALGIISSWIYDKLKKRQKADATPVIRYEDAVVRPDGTVRWRGLEGPADQVRVVLLEESKSSVVKTLAKYNKVIQQDTGSNPKSFSRKKPPRKASRKDEGS